jgi:hypothetical protein
MQNLKFFMQNSDIVTQIKTKTDVKWTQVCDKTC